MNLRLQTRILNLTRELQYIPDCKSKHFSFIVDKNNILSIGWNDAWKTHPLGKHYGYRFGCIHSELAAILRFKGDKQQLKSCTLINTRINGLGIIGISKPCDCCQGLLRKMHFKRVYYTNHQGEFKRYYEQAN
jgi:tRNA(Arg) A34 adenosine deaminase TadA